LRKLKTVFGQCLKQFCEFKLNGGQTHKNAIARETERERKRDKNMIL